MRQTSNWSSSWKSSTDPQKQRKYRQNAPNHVKDNFISANLSEVIREELDTRNLGLRNGDRIKVMRGDHKGREGIVNRIDRDNQKVYVNGITETAVDGSKNQVPLRPSNLQIQGLNLSDEKRVSEFAIDDFESIKVSEDEVEEALEQDEEAEMIEQLQDGDDTEEDEEKEDEGVSEEELKKIEEEIEEELDQEASDQEDDSEAEKESEEEEDEASTDYDGIVSGTIGEAKDAIEEIDSPDYEALIEAEKSGKNRKTMIEYLEGKKED